MANRPKKFNQYSRCYFYFFSISRPSNFDKETIRILWFSPQVMGCPAD